MFRLSIISLLILIEIILTEDQICKPIDCQDKIKECPYGYRKLNDCEVCQCFNPCHTLSSSMICGANRRCYVDRQTNGTFVARCGRLKKFTNREICIQPKTVGFCRAALPRFFYNIMTEKCEEFIYGGCGGNENNFQTIDNCEKTCIEE